MIAVQEEEEEEVEVEVHLRFVILLDIFGCTNPRLGSVWSSLSSGQHMHLLTF